MEQTISLNLTKKSIEKFSEIFNSVETLDTKNIDILVILSIKNKLKICLLSLEEKEFTIIFTKDEFILLKILTKNYLELKNKDKSKSKSDHTKDFDKYLDKKNK